MAHCGPARRPDEHARPDAAGRAERPARRSLMRFPVMSRPVVLGGLFVLMAGALVAQQSALRQNLEILQRGPARIEKVKDGLYVVRGPCVPCTTRGCRPNGPDDGRIHEPGDVAVRVTPGGLILIDNKYPENVDEVLERVKSVSPLPIKYMLNTHSHGDHVSGNG